MPGIPALIPYYRAKCYFDAMSSARAQEAAEDFNSFAERTAAPGRCDASLCFETPKLAEAAQLWREKAGANGLPQRSDFNARTLKSVLPNVVILDRIDDNGKSRYRIRVMGTTIAELLGDFTGKFLDEAVVDPFAQRWFAMLEATNKAGCPLRFFGRVQYGRQDYIAIDMMLAPLGSRAGHADAVLAIACPSYSASHVFHPLVKNKITAADALAS
jgi:hypothetical protein